jgi:succinate dehydrogenase / fumarate reductase, cytochrome b subunit
MTGVMTLTRSSIGKKVIMALTGFVLVGFVVFHMYGNTKLFAGPEAFNEYAVGLRKIGYPIFGYEHLLWVARGILIASVFGHIWAAVALTLQSRQTAMANSVSSMARYGQKKMQTTSYAAYTMRFGGLLILLFIIYHILHLTFGVVGYAPGVFIHPEGGNYQVYHNVIYGFQNPFIVGFYVLTMVFLTLHLYHGVWSMFQTLGLNNAKYSMLFRALSVVIAGVVAIGNITFPLAVFFGAVRL